MDFLSGIKSSVETRNVSYVHHFSIKQIGSKFYLYAHFTSKGGVKSTIGRYNSYTLAKKAVDNILDLRLESYGS
ncbi:MAG: hypothetical protein RR846_00570 [Oscillospiraceae bacterium]